MMLNSAIYSSWDNFLSLLPGSRQDVYFTEAYLLLNRAKGIPECYVFQENENIWLFPYIKKQITLNDSLYWDFESQYGYGGPVTNSNDSGFLQKAENEFFNVMKDAGFVAGLIKFHPLFNNHLLLKNCSTLFFNRNTIGVDLTPDIDAIWMDQVHSKHRNSIRKAEKSGLEYIVDTDFNYYSQFRKLYIETMERNDAEKFYLFDNEYFEMLKKEFKGNSFLAHALLKDQIVSSSIFFYSMDYAHYHLSGSNYEFLTLNPNCFLIYRTIEHFKKLNMKILHLGGGTNSSTNNSLYRFKMRFSNNRYDFYIGEIIFNKPVYDEICTDWAVINPEKVITHQFRLLKYRF